LSINKFLGFKIDEMGANCTDVDECNNIENCKFGTCFNELGSYRCECPKDFKLNSQKNGCIDTRRSKCFDDVLTNGTCSKLLGSNIAYQTCCCTVGNSWGDPCITCPKQSTGINY
jgi:hypothetical protein